MINLGGSFSSKVFLLVKESTLISYSLTLLIKLKKDLELNSPV